MMWKQINVDLEAEKLDILNKYQQEELRRCIKGRNKVEGLQRVAVQHVKQLKVRLAWMCLVLKTCVESNHVSRCAIARLICVMQDVHQADVSRRARAAAHVSSLKAEQGKLQDALTRVKEDTDILINSFLGEQQKVRRSQQLPVVCAAFACMCCRRMTLHCGFPGRRLQCAIESIVQLQPGP